MAGIIGRRRPRRLGLSVSLVALLSTAASAAENIGYVPISGEDSVYVVDTAANTVVKKIRHVGNHPTVLLSTPDRAKVYVDNFGPLSSHISVIDTQTQRVVKKIPTMGMPYASIALSANGRYLFAPTVLSLVQVIDTKTDQVIHTHRVGLLPLGIEASPDGSRFYSFFPNNTVAAYDADTGRQIGASLSVGELPGWSQLSSDGGTLYIFNVNSNSISVIDTAGWKVTDTIDLPSDTFGFFSGTLTPDDRKIYVCMSTKQLVIVDTVSKTVSQVVPTGEDTAPDFIGFSADGRKAYMSDLAGASKYPPLFFYPPFPPYPGHVVVYDTSDNSIIGNISVGTAPFAGVYD